MRRNRRDEDSPVPSSERPERKRAGASQEHATGGSQRGKFTSPAAGSTVNESFERCGIAGCNLLHPVRGAGLGD